jgi:hypothetical protein
MQATFGFNARGMTNAAASELGAISSQVQAVFRAFRPFGDSLDTVLGAALRNIQGISQNSDFVARNTLTSRLKVTNPSGRIGATANRLGGISVTRGARGKSSRHGGEKGPSRETQILMALGYRSVPYNTDFYINLALRNLELILEEGLPEPRTPSEASAFLAEAQRRRAERERQQREAAAAAGISVSEFITLSQTQQGQIDIAGMTLYRQLAGYGG